MVDKIAEQTYINAVLAKLPDVAEKKVHTLKKGDSLWSLAKKELNRKDVSNQEISNYMLLIAKINNLDTIEKMNALKINDKIFLPGKVNDLKSTKKQLTNVEKTASNLIEKLIHNKTLSVKKAELDLPNVDLYHVFEQNPKYSDNYFLKEKALYAFRVDKKSGKVSSLIVNDSEKRVHPLWYDYIINRNGDIHDGQLSSKFIQKLPQIQNKQLFSETSRLFEQYKNNNK